MTSERSSSSALAGSTGAPEHMTRRFVLSVALAVLLVGCNYRVVPTSYDDYAGTLESLSSGDEVPVEARNAYMRLCVERALDFESDASVHRRHDLGLLISGMLMTAIGATLAGAAAAVEGDDGVQDGLAIAAAGSGGLGSLLVGLGALLRTDERHVTERRAAARMLTAARRMLDEDEFDEAAEDCAEAMESVAEAFGRAEDDDVREEMEALIEAIREVHPTEPEDPPEPAEPTTETPEPEREDGEGGAT